MSEHHCIRCGETVGLVWEDAPNVNDAVMFTGRGAYGSRYDLSPELLIVVCDNCLEEAAGQDAVKWLKQPVYVKPEPEQLDWVPGEVEDQSGL